MPVDGPAAPRRCPAAAGSLLGLGIGGSFDGFVLHKLLRWHHMATSAGYLVEGVEPHYKRFRTLS